MKMKRNWLIVGLFSLCMMVSLGSFAQNDLTPEQKADRKVQKMDRELNLTPEQETRLKAIFTDAARNNPRPGEGASKGDKNKFKKQRQETRQKVKAVLTPEQNAKLEQLRADRKDSMMEKRLEKRLGMMKEKLSLSDEQEKKIRGHMQDHITLVKDARAHWKNETEDQRKKEMKSLRKDLNKNIVKELNPDQKKLFKEMKKDNKREKK